MTNEGGGIGRAAILGRSEDAMEHEAADREFDSCLPDLSSPERVALLESAVRFGDNRLDANGP